LFACFKGTVSAKVNHLQQQLQRTDIVSLPDNQKQVKKLNKLESQTWLYEGILQRIAEVSSRNPEKIAKTIEALEYKRSQILQELEPRKPQRYRIFKGIQDSARYLLASQAEKDYEQLKKLVVNILIFTQNSSPSQVIFSEVIEKLAEDIGQNADKISPYRLRLAYKINDLIRVLSAKLVLGLDTAKINNTNQNCVSELQSQIKILSKQFNNLLKIRQDNINELNKRRHEVYNLTKNISDLHQGLSNRDIDIATLKKNTQDLTQVVHFKQSQIDSLNSKIYELQREIESVKDNNKTPKPKINISKNQSSQANQQNKEIAQPVKREKTEKRSQQPFKETRQKIKPEEYKSIINKDDYQYVSAYVKKNGTRVSAYYRRRRNR
jgi:hypothetical protein